MGRCRGNARLHHHPHRHPASAAGGGVLSGTREVTITRVEAFESAVSLDGGRLTEVDDDSGRQLFVPTPLGRHKYLIKSYGPARTPAGG